MLLWTSAAMAVLYGAAFCHRGDSALKTLVKTVPLAALGLHAALSGAPLPLVLALALSALGDLALSRPGQRAFVVGLVAFAAAHLAYVALLWPLAGALPVLPALAVLALGLSTFRWLLPHTGDLRWPVTAYVVIICAMGLAALGQARALVQIGALMFIASDTVLALQLFRMPPASRMHVPTSVLLWTLYYVGQYLIWRGVA